MTTAPHQNLWEAARAGDLAGLNAALAAGADVNARAEFGDSALNWAAEFGHTDLVERLLDAGADLDNRGGADKTPLMNAAFAGQLGAVRALLAHGAQINQDLLTSLHLKVNILEENAEAGYVNPEAAQAWRRFLDYLIETWHTQNPPSAPNPPAN